MPAACHKHQNATTKMPPTKMPQKISMHKAPPCHKNIDVCVKPCVDVDCEVNTDGACKPVCVEQPICVPVDIDINIENKCADFSESMLMPEDGQPVPPTEEGDVLLFTVPAGTMSWSLKSADCGAAANTCDTSV